MCDYLKRSHAPRAGNKATMCYPAPVSTLRSSIYRSQTTSNGITRITVNVSPFTTLCLDKWDISRQASPFPANTTLFEQSFHAALSPPLPAACACTPQYVAIITTVSVLYFSHLHIRSRLTLSTPSPLSSLSPLPSSSACSVPYSGLFYCCCSFFTCSR